MSYTWQPETLALTVRESVGIGTETPSQKLDVRGNSIIDGSLTINQNLIVSGNFQLGTLSVNEFSSDGNLADNSNLAVPTEQAVKTYVDNNLDRKAALNGAADEDFATNNLSVDDSLTVQGAIATNQLNVTGSITAPLTIDDKLTVNNELNVTGTVTANEINANSIIRAADGFRPSTNDWEIARNGDNLEIREPKETNKVWARFKNDTSLHLIGTPNLWVDGKVGIGTTYPSKKLSVKGAIGGSSEGLYFDSSRPNTIIDSEVIKQAEAAQEEARQAIKTAQTAAAAAAAAAAQTVVRARQTLQAAVILIQIGSSFTPSFPLGQQLVAIASQAQALAGLTNTLAVTVQPNAQKVEKLVGAIPDAQEAAAAAVGAAAGAVGQATATRQYMQQAAQLAASLGRQQEAEQANQAAQALEESAQKTLEETTATQEAEQQVAEAVNNPFVEIYAHGISARQENSLIYDTYSFHRWKVRDVERMRLEQNGNFYLNSGNLKLELGNLHIDKGNVGIGTENSAAKLEVAGGETILQQESWQTPRLLNDWVNYGNGFNNAGYFKDSLGIVHLKGLVRGGTADTIFTLPLGYRPSARELHGVSCSPNTIGRVDILPNGTVRRHVGDNAWISLDGITFRAA